MTSVRFKPAHAADDGRLARAAQEGDQSAFGELYERYARMIHGLLLARVPRVDVDDLVQDVFLTAWNRLSEPPGSGGVRRMAGDDRAEPRDRFPSARRRSPSSCRPICRRTMPRPSAPTPRACST